MGRAVESVHADDRVELHPATDAWMQGDRYGTVLSRTGDIVHVKMDKSDRTLRVTVSNLCKIL